MITSRLGKKSVRLGSEFRFGQNVRFIIRTGFKYEVFVRTQIDPNPNFYHPGLGLVRTFPDVMIQEPRVLIFTVFGRNFLAGDYFAYVKLLM